jgi:hypothetical protein
MAASIPSSSAGSRVGRKWSTQAPAVGSLEEQGDAMKTHLSHPSSGEELFVLSGSCVIEGTMLEAVTIY